MRGRLASLRARRYGVLTSEWAAVDGVPLHLWTARAVDVRRPPVLLVHGVVSSRYLLPTAAHLARRHTVVAVDLPGFGPSPLAGRALGISQLADVVGGAIASAGLERPVVVGHSIGAQVVVELALRRPETVRGVVLAGPTGDPTVRSAARLWGRWLATAPREPAAFNALTLRELVEVGPRRMLATARASVGDPVLAKLPGIAVPALVVRGEHDRVAPPQWVERVRAGLGAAPLALIGGVAHTVVFSAPRQLACLITGFCEGVAGAPAAHTGGALASERTAAARP